jgi:hypothetical protein
LYAASACERERPFVNDPWRVSLDASTTYGGTPIATTPRMKRLAILLVLVLCSCHRDYDASFDTSVAPPAYTSRHPRIAFDQGHHNHHSPSNSYGRSPR